MIFKTPHRKRKTWKHISSFPLPLQCNGATQHKTSRPVCPYDEYQAMGEQEGKAIKMIQNPAKPLVIKETLLPHPKRERYTTLSDWGASISPVWCLVASAILWTVTYMDGTAPVQRV